MTKSQSGILSPIPNHARFLEYNLRDPEALAAVLQKLGQTENTAYQTIGLGVRIPEVSGRSVPLLKAFPEMSGKGVMAPSTQADLWCVTGGSEPAEVAERARALDKLLAPALERATLTNAFKYKEGRDLSGYVDGTENPEGEDAISAALYSDGDDALNGSSFVAVQNWIHDLNRFNALSEKDRDDHIGRRLADNVEFDEAPASAHVKRTAQESFDPEAFMLRRSLPFSDQTGDGLVFVAYGKSFDAFEAILNRMVGNEDGISDALFRFSRPVTGGYYWCPPLQGNRLNLKALGI